MDAAPSDVLAGTAATSDFLQLSLLPAAKIPTLPYSYPYFVGRRRGKARKQEFCWSLLF